MSQSLPTIVDAHKIKDSTRADFWKKVTEITVMEYKLKDEKIALDLIKTEMKKSCGDLPLSFDDSGEVVCGSVKSK
jgi:hypothetical protein